MITSAAGAHDQDVRREQAEDRALVRPHLVVDVHAVPARHAAGEAADRVDGDRHGPLLARELGRDRVRETGADVGRRDLLAGEDVRDPRRGR